MSPILPPDASLQACVVVPAHDEQQRIAACLEALADQVGIAPEAYEVIVVLDRCRDQTEQRALEAAAWHPHLRLQLRQGPGRGVGAARRIGMDFACARLLALGRSEGLIACTDADTRVAADWLRAQLDAVRRGARAIGGRIDLDPGEAALLPAQVLGDRARMLARRAEHVRPLAEHRGERTFTSAPAHGQFSGASMSVTVATYAEVGGLDPHPALEDEGFERMLRRHRVPIDHAGTVRVTTSARRRGRADRGLARDLAVADWFARRSYEGSDYTLEGLLALKRESIALVLPAREVAETIGPIVDALLPLQAAGLVDELLVVDAASQDGTAAVAERHGATVAQESELLAEQGPACGKGDAMWRGLSATSSEIVAYIDSDTTAFDAGFALGLLGPLLGEPSIGLVKGAFGRPFRVGQATIPDGGGRVTELMARPLINLHFPALAGFVQPLAGETAGRRGLLEALPFAEGYGVELGLLVDAERLCGLDALAQVNLGVRQNRHQSLGALGEMAYAILIAAERRLSLEPLSTSAHITRARGGGLETPLVAIHERPPLAALRAGMSAAAPVRVSQQASG